MANAVLKKDERRTPYDQGKYVPAQEVSSEEEILGSFQTLEVDEARLTEQKEHLSALLSQLESKAKEELDRRRRRIERLNSEVSELKRKCEKFANWINPESAVECTQAGL